MCSLCGPVYAGFLSALGLGFLISTVYLFRVTAVLLLLAAGSLAFRASRRRGLQPFWLGLGAAVLVPGGKFYLESAVATYVGVILLGHGLPVERLAASLPRPPWPFFCVPAKGGSQNNEMGKGEMQL